LWEVGFQESRKIYSAAPVGRSSRQQKDDKSKPRKQGKAITGVTTGQRLAQLDTPNTEQQDCEQHNIRKRKEHRTTKARNRKQKRRFSCLSDEGGPDEAHQRGAHDVQHWRGTGLGDMITTATSAPPRESHVLLQLQLQQHSCAHSGRWASHRTATSHACLLPGHTSRHTTQQQKSKAPHKRKQGYYLKKREAKAARKSKH
jgi:hypothetical protein